MIAIPYMTSVGVVSYFLHFLAQRSAKREILNVLGDRRVLFSAFLGTTVGKKGDFERFRRPSCPFFGISWHNGRNNRGFLNQRLPKAGSL